QYWTLKTATGVGRTYCDFTSDSAVFASCIDDLVANNRGDERGWQSMFEILDERWLPVQANNAARIRPDASVAVVVVADSGDQSRAANQAPEGTRAAGDVAGWTTWAQGGAGAITW